MLIAQFKNKLACQWGYWAFITKPECCHLKLSPNTNASSKNVETNIQQCYVFLTSQFTCCMLDIIKFKAPANFASCLYFQGK